MAVELPDAFIRVEDRRVTHYTVTIKFDTPKHGMDREFTTEMRQGLIYLAPLPEDVDATYTLKPKSHDYTGNTYTLTAQQYREKWYSSQGKGHMDTHDFELKPTGKNKDPKIEYPGGYGPRWGTDRGYNVEEATPQIYAISSEGGIIQDNAGGACFCMPLLTIVLAGVAAALNQRFF